VIEPTVGRVVWYRPTHADPLGSAVEPTKRYAAHVADVLPDGTVNLLVISPMASTFDRVGVTLVQEGEPEPGQCQWMPYQKGQAAKTESLLQREAAQAAEPITAPVKAKAKK
jgi:hypothetical protein